MVRLANVRMRSMLLLVQFLSTCSGIDFKEPDEYSCDHERVSPTGKSSPCMCESGKCTLNVTLVFGHVAIPEASTGLHGPLHMLGFNTPGEDGLPFEFDKATYVNGTSPGPTLRVRAGDTLKILLHNNLPHEMVDTGSIKKVCMTSTWSICTRTGCTCLLASRVTRSFTRAWARTRCTSTSTTFQMTIWVARTGTIPTGTGRSRFTSTLARPE